MSVDIADLVDSMRREITPLSGNNPYADVTDETLEGYLSDAFWEGRLNKMFEGFTLNIDTGLITAISGDEDMDRVDQQAIVLWAGYRTVLNDMRNVQSSFRAEAGPVAYEVQRSASVLAEVLKAIKERIDRLIDNLSTGNSSTVYALDAVISNTYSLSDGDSWWVR